MKRPASVVYWLDEVPPLAVTLGNALQYVAVISINLIYPLLIFRAIQSPEALVADLISIAMIVVGLATFLQACRLGPIGTGYLCPSTLTAVYLTPSLLAVRTGGLPLLFGMTFFAGVLEALLSRALGRLRAILPVELSGLVIFMIAISAGVAGLRSLIGASAAPVTRGEWWVAGITLAAMVGFNVWGKGLVRMLCALIGLALGYAAAAAAGLFGAAQFATVQSLSWVALPGFGHLTWSFDITLTAAFAIAALAATMKAVGTITMCQRMNDAEWARPDMASNARGVLADGLGTMLAGALGSLGVNTSTPSVGLVSATGVTSRVVALGTGALFIALGLMPKLSGLLAAMPRAVMVAALLFSTCFILINGLQVMTSRLLDARRTLVIGLSIMAGIAVEVFSVIAESVPSMAKPIVGSSLVLAALIGLGLNLLFRIGIKSTVRLAVEPGAIDAHRIEQFFRAQGAAWGARPDVIARATFGVNQLVEAVAENCWRAGSMTVEASFDEFNLDVELTYHGELLEFPDRRPADQEIRDTDEGMRRLAGFMLRHNADRVQSDARDGQARVRFHFDH